MPRNQWLVVGIGGVTNGGKTTLANGLKYNLPGSVILHQDMYFLPEDDPRHVYVQSLNHHNWDILTAVDMEKLFKDALNVLESNVESAKKQLLVLDGFLIFAYKPLADLCDLKYFIDMSKEACWERRQTRNYEPPDVPGYFDQIVWPEYEKQKSALVKDDKLRESIVFLDGTESKASIFNKVFADVVVKLS